MTEENNTPQETVSDITEETSQVEPEIRRMPKWCRRILFIIIPAALLMATLAVVYVLDYGSVPDPLSPVGRSLLGYSKKNNGQFPEKDKWCDIMLKLAEEDEEKRSIFKDYKSNKNSFPFTLNKNIFECKGTIPGDMVLVFEGQGGWNQVGGPELAKDDKYIDVFLVNGVKEKDVKKKYLPYLRWKIEDGSNILRPDHIIPYVIISSILAVIFLRILLVNKAVLKIFCKFAVWIGFSAAMIGAALGALTGLAYEELGNVALFVGPFIGGISGFVIGVCFVAIIGGIYKKYNANVSMAGYATVIGAVTGAAASSIVHSYLMIACDESNFLFMLCGSGFGMIAGALLGWISSRFIRRYKNDPAIINTTTEQDL